MTPSRQEIDHSDHHPAIESSEIVDRQARRDPFTTETSEELLHEPTKIPKPKKNEDHEQVRDPCHSEIPEWLQEFRENQSCEWKSSWIQRLTRVFLMNHFKNLREVWIWVSTEFILTSRKTEVRDLPKDQNHKGSVQKAYWHSRTSCRKIWWRVWISKQSSTWNRGARLGHPMDPVVSVQNKTSQETQRSLQKFLEPERKPKVIYTDNSLEFGKACEDPSWNHCTSTPHRSQHMGLLREQCAEWKKLCLLYCCTHFWMKVGGQISWNVTPICETSQIY